MKFTCCVRLAVDYGMSWNEIRNEMYAIKYIPYDTPKIEVVLNYTLFGKISPEPLGRSRETFTIIFHAFL